MGRRASGKRITPQMPDPTVFDLQQLRRYTVYQNDLEVELIQLFRQQMPQFVRQIRNAKTAYDWKLATHSLKGSAVTIGAPVVAVVAEQLEELGHDGASGTRMKLLLALDEAVAEFDRAIEQFYA